MANRYWVGGPSSATASWTDTSHWSASSGGASGASVPTSADDVFFDGSSGISNSRVTFGGSTGECRDLNVTVAEAFTVDLCFINGTFNVYGSLNNAHGIICFGLGGNGLGSFAMNFKATSTGKTIFLKHADSLGTDSTFQMDNGALSFDGVGGEWTLASNLIMAGSNKDFVVKNGSFITANYNFNCSTFNSNFSNVRAITLGSSTVTMDVVSSSFTPSWDITDTTNLTFSAGTSTIIMIPAGSTANFKGGSLTYYDLTLKNRFTTNSNFNIYGSNTFNNFTILGTGVGIAKKPIANFEAGKTQTMGTLTVTGESSAPVANFSGSPLSGSAPLTVNFLDASTFGNVVKLRSLTAGSTTTISAANTALEYLDVKDVIALGAATPFDATLDGVDRGNNTGWEFSDYLWEWDFKNNGNDLSTDRDPSFVYSPRGRYTVKLTVNNNFGSDSEIKTVYISAINPASYLQTAFLVAADTAGDVQMINMDKDDDGTAIYYELETQELEFGNRAHRKVITGKIAVATQNAGDSKLQLIENDKNPVDIKIDMAKPRASSESINLKANYLTAKWFGNADDKSPVLEGIFLPNVGDEGVQDG